VSEHTFKDIYKSVQNLEAGNFVTFNGFPMIVETQTTTYNRYYGELRWVNQLDGKLQIDVTVRVGINFDSEVTRLKAEVERLTAFTTRTIIPNEELQAQVERLTKAGDDVLHTLLWTDEYSVDRYKDAEKKWNAAKEGKPGV